MTVLEIYNQILFNVFGNTPNVPANVVTYLRGDEGLIAKIHQKIQVDADYWFMRAKQRYSIGGKVTKETTLSTSSYEAVMSDATGVEVGMAAVNDNIPEETFITAITPQILLSQYPTAAVTENVIYAHRRIQMPGDFKRENMVTLRLSGYGYQIKRVSATEISTLYTWNTYTQVPLYYWLFGDYIWFDGNLISDCDVVLDYYKVLPFTDADNFEDDITTNGSDVIIMYCCYNLASILQDLQKAKFFAEMYNESLQMLHRKNLMRESAFDNYDVRLV